VGLLLVDWLREAEICHHNGNSDSWLPIDAIALIVNDFKLILRRKSFFSTLSEE
jgi:hypothetical protein